METLQPNEQGDWLNQRNDVFDTFIPMGEREIQMETSFLSLFILME